MSTGTLFRWDDLQDVLVPTVSAELRGAHLTGSLIPIFFTVYLSDQAETRQC